MCEEGNVRSWVFSREVCFSADYKVEGFEVVEGGENLRRVEGWVERYLGKYLASMYKSRYYKKCLTSIAPSLKSAYVVFTTS
jgi:hypothetical protein